MKEMIFKHYSRILDELLDDYNFWRHYFQNPYYLDEDVLGEYEGGVFAQNSLDIRFGISRGCLIDNCYDYVVKFNLPEAEEKASCDMEVEIYSWARHEGLERFFAEPIYLGVYTKTIHFYSMSDIQDNIPDFYGFDEEDFSDKLQIAVDNWDMEKEEITISIPLYAYPRAERYNFGYPSQQEVEHFRSTHSDASPLLERSDSIGICFVKEYGEEAFDALSDFLYRNKINDLHTSNVMNCGGHLILTDYCGYHSDY